MNKIRFYVCMMYRWKDRKTVVLMNAQPILRWNDDGWPETPAGAFVSNTPKDFSIAIYDIEHDRILINGYPEHVGFDELRDAFIELFRNHCDYKIKIKW